LTIHTYDTKHIQTFITGSAAYQAVAEARPTKVALNFSGV